MFILAQLLQNGMHGIVGYLGSEGYTAFCHYKQIPHMCKHTWPIKLFLS